MDCISPSTAATESATSGKPASWLDLEPHIHDARSAARVLSILLDEALRSHHPLQKSGDGYASLWLSDEIIDALNFTTTNLLVATRQAADTFNAASDARQRD